MVCGTSSSNQKMIERSCGAQVPKDIGVLPVETEIQAREAM